MTWIPGGNSTNMSLYIGPLLGTLNSAFCSVVEFVQTIRSNRPCRMNKCFKAEATNIEWEEYNHDHFQAWCDGKTGFPLWTLPCDN
jgi:hypothetical protein